MARVMMHEGAPMVFPAARAVDRRRAPAVRGQPRLWIRAEGAAIAIAAFAAWVQLTGRPGLFALLFLLPDLAMLGYLAGPRLGALAYNAVHAYAGPAACALVAAAGGPDMLAPVAALWAAHVGVDRALGFGLKYPTAFGDTHLGRIGRQEPGGDGGATA